MPNHPDPLRKPIPEKSPGRQPLAAVVGILLVASIFWAGSISIRSPYIHPPPTPTPTSTPTSTPTATHTLVPSPTPTATLIPPTPTITPTPTVDPLAANTGYMILSMSDGYYAHLFAYHPQSLPLTRLTENPWDDRQPAISPDGSKIAFSSRRNGYWDIYILSLSNGELIRVSDTPQYDGSPTWSPDGQWLAFETYIEDNLEIVLQSLNDLSQAPIRLTTDPAADYSPKWSPLGRQIAFVSTTSGDEEIWLADLDNVNDRFTNLSQDESAVDFDPAWSPDGRAIAWTSQREGIDRLYIYDTLDPAGLSRQIGSGRSAVSSPDGSVVAATVQTPDQTALVAYRVGDGKLGLPPAELPAAVNGIDWEAAALPGLIVQKLLDSEDPIPPVLYQQELSNPGADAHGRLNLVEIPGVNAPYPYLQDSADESFNALRREVARQTGWDLLGELVNLFIPITEPPHPGLVDEWLYTGRGLALMTSPVQAGYMLLAREIYNGTIYWRIWIRARYQDGSQGEPMRTRPWNLDARFSGDLRAYEEGGAVMPVPPGYWVDVTELFARFGWHPLPALSNWRTYYPAARFNQFAFTEGLDWETAMAQIYPPEAYLEPTSLPSLVASLLNPTPTRMPMLPLPDETGGPTPTFRPTWTPLPEE